VTIRLENLRAAMDEAATRTVSRQIASGASAYSREQHLPALIGQAWQHLTDAEIITRLEVKIRTMQRLVAVTGHHSADVNRLLALRQALAGEKLWRGMAGPGQVQSGIAGRGAVVPGKAGQLGDG
jgi:hypothetical protein